MTRTSGRQKHKEKTEVEVEIDFIRDIRSKYGKLGESEKQRYQAKAPVSRRTVVRNRLQEIVDLDTAEELARARELAQKKQEQEKKQKQINDPLPYGKASDDVQKPYPLCMEYYEPYNVGIFGLVTKQVQIHQLSRTGVKRKFTHLQSLKVMHMIMGLTVDEYKGTAGTLMLCVSTKSDKHHVSEVLAYVLDPKLDFEVL